MNANELRIGNRIYDVMADRYIEVDIAYISMCNNEPDLYQPIELSTLIISKCGFEKVSGIQDGYTVFRRGDYLLEKTGISGKYRLRFVAKTNVDIPFDGISFRLTEVNSLHHLQNIFFDLEGQHIFKLTDK